MIREFMLSGSIAKAAKKARIHRRTHFRWMERDATYREKFNEARQIYVERLEEEADRRAVEGVLRQKFWRGEPIVLPCEPDEPGAVQIKREDGTEAWVRPYFERTYSDNLLMFRLKRLDPAYRDRVGVSQKQPRRSPSLPRQGESIYAALRKRLCPGKPKSK